MCSRSPYVQQHRSLQPTGPPAQGPSQQNSHARLNDSFETIRQEFDLLASDLNVLRGQRDEYESKITSQVNELNIIRQSLYELEIQHGKIRGHYEEEVNRLRSELLAVRQGLPANATQPPTVGPGGIGPPGPSGPPTTVSGISSGSFNDPYFGRDRDRDRERDRDRLPERDREREIRDRERDKERERSADHRDPKRLKLERDRDRDRLQDRDNRMKVDRPGKHFPSNLAGSPPPHGYRHHSPSSPRTSFVDHFSPSLGPGNPKLPPAPGITSVSTPGLGPGLLPPPPTHGPYPPTSSSTAPPADHAGSISGPSSFPDDLDPHTVSPEFKKEGSDWFAVFNPKCKKGLDVNLTHTLMHESVVCCVRFSADGKYLATGCNRSAQIYDTKTGAKTHVLVDKAAGAKGGDLYIRSVCFSPDGKYLATGAEDKKIRIWDIQAGTICRVFEGHQQEIYSLDFSQDGQLIVSGSGDKTARIWNMDSQSMKVLAINDPDSSNTDAGVTSVAISPNGQLVAAGSLDAIVRIWDVVTGNLLERLRGHRDSVYSVAFTPDGKGLVSGSLDKTLKYWDVTGLISVKGRKEGANNSSNGSGGLTNGKKDSDCVMNFTGHKDYVLSVAVSHDGQWVVSGSKDRGVQFWDSHTAIVQFMLQGHKNSVISIDLSPAGNVLATGSGDWQARICMLNLSS
ncbi:hypothetical protein PILCRDRAFT_57890 [Piloderma croceum F 1598]|uniref:Transcriptional repressor Tup1 N-terminal domain-containing protein n=1 Tax=Piloderma croceum (strain F 1598) TaxID=765440 RepID=A0A0C3BYR7_PILCF|nr:hypothetical protein PILCRDRAFT_57890 [Piloderma croceum F 1598]